MKETKFKNTEIGKIPKDWEVTSIGKVCNVRRGVRVTKEQLTDEGRYPVYQNTNYPMGYFDNYNADANTPFVIVGGSAGQIGLSKERYWAADDCAYFEKSNTLNKVFLYYDLTHRQFEIKKFVRTASVPRLDRKVIEDFVLPLPSLHEQHRIASALTSIDNLISSLGKLIEKKKNIKQGAMQQLLTGKTRLKGFNEPWMEKKLGDIGSLAMCKRIFQEETFEKGDVPFYKIGTFGQQADAYITKVKYEQFKQMYRFPQKGDVLISAAGTIGRTVIYNGEPAYFQDSNIVWLAHNGKYITNNFLFYIYQRTDWNTEDTTIARLYNNNFNNTCIHFPSSITEQQAIANILSKMDNEITALEIKKAKYEAIKQGMMQQLLTGKIRLIS